MYPNQKGKSDKKNEGEYRQQKCEYKDGGK